MNKSITLRVGTFVIICDGVLGQCHNDKHGRIFRIEYTVHNTRIVTVLLNNGEYITTDTKKIVPLTDQTRKTWRK